MKKVLLPMLVIAGLTSCNTYNDKMNTLLQNKSQLESEFYRAEVKMSLFEIESTDFLSKELDKNNFDVMSSPVYKQLGDSVHKYASIAQSFKSELSKVNYSIDSLSKLK
jgi:hypothetical protein